jgi:hypothetical protein
MVLGLMVLSGAARTETLIEKELARVWSMQWPETDFTNRRVNLEEISSTGLNHDDIPAIEAAFFLKAHREKRLDLAEPVIALEIEGLEPRAYPVRYLLWHEIVNDEIDGVPIAVTHCPLCNSAQVFIREVQGKTMSFGVTGKLRHSDLIMYDRQSHTWWQQLTGQAIVGVHTGETLQVLPSWSESWGEYIARNPDGLVMDQPAADRSYGQTPYRGYDTEKWPALYNGDPPPFGLAPLSRVVQIGNRAWPLERLKRHVSLHEVGFDITWNDGQSSVLDHGVIAKGRPIGSIRVRDALTGQDVVHDVPFAFAFHAFYPDGIWMTGN